MCQLVRSSNHSHERGNTNLFTPVKGRGHWGPVAVDGRIIREGRQPGMHVVVENSDFL